MPHKRILLDSNVYLRMANTFHPLLNDRFGDQGYVLCLIPEFQKEFNKNPRLKNKFGWVDQAEYIENRKRRLRILKDQIEQINRTYTYIWAHNIGEGIDASRVDVKALAYGSVLDLPVVTDDQDMAELGNTFGIEIWGLMDLLKVMFEAGRIQWSEIKTLVAYLKYNKDLPYPSFEQDLFERFKKVEK